MWGWIALTGVSILGILPSFLKSDAPKPPDDQLFRLSLLLGIAVSAFTLYSYIRKG